MGISLKISYIPTIPGILKIVEIVLFLLAFSLAAAFSNSSSTAISGFSISVTTAIGSASKVEYFVAIAVITWIYCLVHFFICLFGVYDSINLFYKSLIVGIIHAVLAFLVLIGASVAASYVGNVKDKTTCEQLSSGSNTTCATIEAAAAFGFFGMVALIADAVFHIIKGRSGDSAGTTTSEKSPEAI